VIPAPRIDSRTAVDIAQQLRTLLSTYAPEWKGAGVSGDFGDALVRIFARYAEIVTERLNRTPEKNLLAYLDLLGTSLLPPQPARVPLTFSLAAGSAADGVVPAATQVAAPPAEGDTAPLIFETERELVVIAAALDKVFARDPGTDHFADLSPSVPVGSDRRAFRGTTPIDHSLYIGLDDLLGRSDLRELRLDFVIGSGPSPLDPRDVSWSIVDSAGGTPKAPRSDGTAGLAHSGGIVFADLPAVPRQSVNELQSRWLRGRLTTAIAPGEVTAAGRVRASHLAPVTGLTVSADLGRQGVPVDRAYGNAAPLDTTKDFFPFGERPGLGDALYLSAGDAFAVAGAQVTMEVTLSKGVTPNAGGKPELQWEYWDGGRWVRVAEFKDDTAALTTTGKVTFRLGPHPAVLAVNGADGYWLRVRIAAGNYGGDAGYVPVDATGYRYVPPTFAPPSIAAVTVGYALTLTGQRADTILTYNDFGYAEMAEGASFQPFRPIADDVPTLYLGFALPDGRSAFPNRPVALYFGIAEPDSGTPPDPPSPADPSPAGPPHLVWECWEGDGAWRRPGLRDGTQGLTRPGVLEFLTPAAFALRQEFGAKRYWLRCRLEAGHFAFEPRLQQVLLNTTMADHATTILDETLGSSDGGQSQRYVTTRRPVLHHDREELRVREPDLPSADERAALEAAGGDDAVAVTRDAGGRPIEVWVRWKEVKDFYGSGPRDRHYVFDHVTGTVTFGDGVNGLVPPPGAGNLRLARYRTGGGSAGNCAAGTIVQLKTTIPYVDDVTNAEPARGGADAETIDSLRERGPREIRHRYRAVTIEDYEDLAMLASPEVARAKCVPLYDLSVHPVPDPKPGTVSVIVVPRSTQAKPWPSRVLLERVASYLDARRLPVVDLRIVAPDYVEVDIAAEVALTSIDRASEVQPRIVDSLTRFLHPLTGGFDGTGWDFGRRPQKSDLLRRIGGIAGVDHVRSLTFTETPHPPDNSLALVYAGALDIAVAAMNA
jgi:Baseplate J-like protein